MAESTRLEDFITENELISKFGLKIGMIHRARKRDALPCYQISQQGPRLYLKSELTDYFLSRRTISESKKSPKRRIRKRPKANNA